MALSPAEINQTLEVARNLQSQFKSTQAFILAWSAWEAYNYRFIVTAVQIQGLTQKDVRSVLSDLSFHQDKRCDESEPRSSQGVPSMCQESDQPGHGLNPTS